MSSGLKLKKNGSNDNQLWITSRFWTPDGVIILGEVAGYLQSVWKKGIW